MRVAIIGAGIAGLVNARVLLPLGVDVVVYEARSDPGGVWSGTRGYPGQRIQNDKRTYGLSDFPMPAEYPAHPDRREVQAWLAAYSRRHGLDAVLRLSTTVTAAEYEPGTREWRITAEGPAGPVEDRADWLIVANGTLSTPNRPVLPGADAFVRAGGRIVDPADLGDGADLGGQRVVLLGYGKSATDIAVAAAGRAAAITVLARSVPWKLPERIGPFSFEQLVSSRIGEHVLWAPYRSVGGRVLRRIDTGARMLLRGAVARRVRRQTGLDRRGLVPDRSIRELSHLVTPGFDEAVDAGLVDLRVGAHLERLDAGPDGPQVRLADGTVLPADLLVTATGYRTDLAFLDDRTRALLLDEDGRMPLVRHTAPPRAPRLLLAGWANSFRSPIADELQAVWIGALLHDAIRPSRRPSAAAAAPTGLSIVDQDAWLQDAGLPVPLAVVVGELLQPVDPSAYAGVHRRLQERIAALRRQPLPPRVRRARAERAKQAERVR